MKIKWIIFSVLIFLFVVIAYLVTKGQMDYIDNFIYQFVAYQKTPGVTGFYKLVTVFASIFVILSISLLSLLILSNKRYGILIVINATNLLILNTILKLIFMRERPFDLMIINETGYSFPSGHAMAAFGFYGFIIYLLMHMDLSKYSKLIFISFAVMLIVLIGLSRIYLGVHYASDVLAGYLISGAYLILYISIVKKFLKKEVSHA